MHVKTFAAAVGIPRPQGAVDGDHWFSRFFRFANPNLENLENPENLENLENLTRCHD